MNPKAKPYKKISQLTAQFGLKNHVCFRTIFYILLSILLSFNFTSCEIENEWEPFPSAMQTVVVDGILTDNNTRQTIHLCRPISQLNQKPEAIRGAQVQVSNAEKVYNFTESPEGSGVYISDTAFAGATQFEYSLLATIEGKAYTAKAQMKPSVDFEKAKYNYVVGKKLFRINWIANPYEENNPAMYELLLDWSGVEGYQNSSYEQTHARIYYYSLQTLDVSELLAPTIESIFFPAGTIIIEKKYSLTTEHAAFLRGLLLETNWQGGLFNTTSSQVPSNISNGGLGYFAACSVLEKTWKVE